MIRLFLLVGTLTVAAPAFARVPDVREVQDAALLAANLGDHNLDRWSSRARIANLLSQVTISTDLGVSDTESEDYRELLAADEEDFLFKTLQNDSGTQNKHDWNIRVGLTWKPSGMVFDSAELNAARIERLNTVHRAKILEEVTFLFFEWRDAERASQRAPHEQRELHYDRSEVAAARLDALTNGWFRQTLAQKEVQ